MFSALNWKIGFYLAFRQIKRGNIWTTSLIIFVMVLTFLNLVVVSGVLVGLIQGAIDEQRKQYTSDVIISTLPDKPYMENSQNIIALLDTVPEIEHYTARYMDNASLEANYATKREADKPNITGTSIAGIDPLDENAVTNMASKVIEGSYLAPGDFDQILLGSFLLKQYIPVESPGLQALSNVVPGSKIRISVAGVTKEVTVKGIVKSKVQDISRAAFMIDSQFRSIIGRADGNLDQIAIKLKPGADPLAVKNTLTLSGIDKVARVQTYADAQPQFLKDVITTFGMLGTAFSSIGLVVASITIFIVVFINAITRRKFIGILKGIGVSGRAIEISYIFQSIFYATLGSAIGLALVYGFLVPFVREHPIDFPFSDGILVAPVDETLFRVGLLIASTVIAGFIPAWMIVRKNTLDSILGRN